MSYGFIPTIKSAGGGFMSSYALCLMKVWEAEEREKGSYKWSTLNQAFLAAFVAKEVFETQPPTEISSWIFSAGVGVAVLLNGKLASQESPPFVATLIHNHIGTVALVVSVACNLFFCTAGFPFFGGMALLCLSVTLIDQAGYLPSRLHDTLFGSEIILIHNISRIAFGDPILKVYGLGSIIYEYLYK